jgi:hypothetical protein
MSLQFSYADHSLRRSRPASALPEVVPHVTTLRAPLAPRQLAARRPSQRRNASAGKSRREVEGTP